MIQSVVNYGMKDSVKYFFIFFFLHTMNKLRKKKNIVNILGLFSLKKKKRGSHNICLPVYNRMLDSSMSTKMQNKNYPPK